MVLCYEMIFYLQSLSTLDSFKGKISDTIELKEDDSVPFVLNQLVFLNSNFFNLIIIFVPFV